MFRTRDEYLSRAAQYEQEGNTQLAIQNYQRCVDICPNLAKMCIEELKKNDIEFIVAPYEADAQVRICDISNNIDSIYIYRHLFEKKLETNPIDRT